MKIKEGFEVMNVAGDYLAIPLGDNMNTFNGSVVLNEVSAFLLENLKQECTLENLVNKVLCEYDIDKITAEQDVADAVNEMISIGIVEE